MNIKAYAWDDEDYGGSYILYATFKRKNFLTILKNKERVRTMTKKNVNDK